MRLLRELRRRNIFKVSLLYFAVTWLLFQLTDIAGQFLGSPWIARFTLAVLLICFPLLLVFSYLYEITPEGLRKERNVARELSITKTTGKKITRLTLMTLLLALLIWVIRNVSAIAA